MSRTCNPCTARLFSSFFSPPPWESIFFFCLQSHNLSSALLCIPSISTQFSNVTFYWMFNVLIYLDKIHFSFRTVILRDSFFYWACVLLALQSKILVISLLIVVRTGRDLKQHFLPCCCCLPVIGVSRRSI